MRVLFLSGAREIKRHCLDRGPIGDVGFYRLLQVLLSLTRFSRTSSRFDFKLHSQLRG